MLPDYPAVLRELLIAGYEGAALLSAFERMCTAMGAAVSFSVASAPKSAQVRQAKSATAPRPQPVVHAPPDNAKAIGRKALAASGLASSAIAVGSQLLEHYNLTTGRCDPGAKALARKTGVPLRSVQRAISELVGAGLFTVAQNAGRGHANAYFPNWPRLVELAESVSTSPPKMAQTPAKSGGQNHLRKPDLDLVKGNTPRKRRVAAPDPRQRHMLLPMAGGRVAGAAVSASSPAISPQREAVKSALFKAANGQLLQIGGRGPQYQAVLTQLIALDCWDEAVTAEMRKRGEGLAMLLSALPSPRRAAG